MAGNNRTSKRTMMARIAALVVAGVMTVTVILAVLLK